MMQTKQHTTSVPCPTCHGEMIVRELACPDCNITVRGDFGRSGVAGPAADRGIVSRFDKLSPEQVTFLEAFLRSRGIIRDVEAALGISYPTVRARLDNLLNALELTGQAQAQSKAEPVAAEKPSVKEILARLDSGSMDAQAALDALRDATSPTHSK